MAINSVNLTGNLTRNVELRQTPQGTSVATFGIAVNERVKNNQSQQGEDKPNFFECTVFGARAEHLESFIHKGSKVGVSGKLRFSQGQTQTGEKRNKVDIVVNDLDFISTKQQQQEQQQQQQQQPAFQPPQQQQQAAFVPPKQENQADAYEDEIPF